MEKLKENNELLVKESKMTIEEVIEISNMPLKEAVKYADKDGKIPVGVIEW